MTHRYYTRFQARQAIQAIQAIQEKPNTVNVPNPSDPSELRNQIRALHTMLNQVSSESNLIKKALIATRIYHFLEYNYTILSRSPKFREIVHAKANEFIVISNERNHTLKYVPIFSYKYSKLQDLALVTQELRESCERVLDILKTIT